MDSIKSSKRVLTVIYIIGVICVCALLARMIIGGNKIINPYAMIPTTYFTGSNIILAVGSSPMCLVSFLLFVFSEKSKLRFLLFTPAVITLASLVYCIASLIHIF